jgi:hypothetical protein
MSRSHVRVVPILSVLAAAVLLVTASTAMAAAGPTTASRTGESPSSPIGSLSPVPITPQPSSTTVDWVAAPCATGQFGTPEVDAEHHVLVPAEITNCGVYKPSFRFTVVSFRPTYPVAFAFSTQLRPYQPTGPTSVQVALVSPAQPGPVGICLVRSPTVRVACLKLTYTAAYQVTWEPLAIDDPLVTKPVVVVDEAPGDPGGYCVTCIWLPWV